MEFFLIFGGYWMVQFLCTIKHSKKIIIQKNISQSVMMSNNIQRKFLYLLTLKLTAKTLFHVVFSKLFISVVFHKL